MHMPNREGELRRDLARCCKWVSRLGFTPGTAGNLSVRLGPDRLLATPTGVSKYLLKPADMVVVNSDGRLLSGERNVTSEIAMHLAVYRRRGDVGAVIHSHPPTATAFACSGRSLDEFLCQEAVMALGAVPLAEYATTGTSEVASSLVPFILKHDAILMANHGAVSYGETLHDALYKMETLEHLAQISLVAHQLGSAQNLRPDQVEKLYRAKKNYVQKALETPVEEAAAIGL